LNYETQKAQDYYGLERCFALNRFWDMDDGRSFLRAIVLGVIITAAKRSRKISNMVVRQPRYSKEEFAQRGDTLLV
jgi:hypothetical protein